MFSISSFGSGAARRAAAVFVIIGLLGGCGVSDPKSPQFVVAKGRGVKITRGELDKVKNGFLAQRGGNQAALPPGLDKMLDKQILEQLVMEKLLLNLGARLKIADLNRQVDEGVQQIRSRFSTDEKAFNDQMAKMGLTMEKLKEEIRRQVLIREVLKVNVPPAAAPTDTEIEQFYKEKEKNLVTPQMVRASHVLVKVPEGATPEVKQAKKKIIDSARARIVKKKEDFGKVAREVSEDPGSAAKGGELQGYFAAGDMVPEFEKVAFNSKVGDISPVFETKYGFHFLKVLDNKPAQKTSLEEARPRIQRHLQERQDMAAREAFFKKVQADAKVQYFLAPPEPADKPISGAPVEPKASDAPAPR